MPVKNVMIFLLGAGVGSIGMYFGVKKHFETYMNDELEAQREYFEANYIKLDCDMDAMKEDDSEETKPEESVQEEPDYEEIIQKMNYGAYSQKEKKQDTPVVADQKKDRFAISGDDFAGDEDHPHVSMLYFENDGVFMNAETWEVMPEGTELVGEENLDKFGEYEEDVLFIQNNITSELYEIILEHEAFAESKYYDQGQEDN